MKILLLRHAARPVHESHDPSLSELGRRQAEALVANLAPHGAWPTPTLLLASPKKRARETLMPLSLRLALEIRIEPMLDERTDGESSRQLQNRVRSFLEGLKVLSTERKRAVVWMCSHMDWLEAALIELGTESADAGGWANCQARLFRLKDGEWTIAGGLTLSAF